MIPAMIPAVILAVMPAMILAVIPAVIPGRARPSLVDRTVLYRQPTYNGTRTHPVTVSPG